MLVMLVSMQIRLRSVLNPDYDDAYCYAYHVHYAYYYAHYDYYVYYYACYAY